MSCSNYSNHDESKDSSSDVDGLPFELAKEMQKSDLEVRRCDFLMKNNDYYSADAYG